MAKKAFRIFLLSSGIFFLCLSATCAWVLVTETVPTDEELVQECEDFFSEGHYSNFDEDEKLGACLEDSYKAVGIAPFLPLFLLVLFGMLGLISLYAGMKKALSDHSKQRFWLLVLGSIVIVQFWYPPLPIIGVGIMLWSLFGHRLFPPKDLVKKGAQFWSPEELRREDLSHPDPEDGN